jgi:hypothetical protein
MRSSRHDFRSDAPRTVCGSRSGPDCGRSRAGGDHADRLRGLRAATSSGEGPPRPTRTPREAPARPSRHGDAQVIVPRSTIGLVSTSRQAGREAQPRAARPSRRAAEAQGSRPSKSQSQPTTQALEGEKEPRLGHIDGLHGPGSLKRPRPPFSGGLGSDVIQMVRMRGLEPPPSYLDTDLNRARLPIPPHPRGGRVAKISQHRLGYERA